MTEETPMLKHERDIIVKNLCRSLKRAAAYYEEDGLILKADSIKQQITSLEELIQAEKNLLAQKPEVSWLSKEHAFEQATFFNMQQTAYRDLKDAQMRANKDLIQSLQERIIEPLNTNEQLHKDMKNQKTERSIGWFFLGAVVAFTLTVGGSELITLASG